MLFPTATLALNQTRWTRSRRITRLGRSSGRAGKDFMSSVTVVEVIVGSHNGRRDQLE